MRSFLICVIVTSGCYQLPADLKQSPIPRRSIAMLAMSDCIPLTFTDIKLNGVVVPDGTKLLITDSIGFEQPCTVVGGACSICVHGEKKYGGVGMRLDGAPKSQQVAVLWSQVTTVGGAGGRGRAVRH